MADREKVKTGLELCQQGFDCPEDCPYLDDCNDLMKPMFIELAKDALALLKEQPQWIPVSERLPKSMANKVIVYLQHEDYVPQIGYGHYEKFQGEEMWYDLESDEQFSKRGYTVTHWMPMPKSPFGEKLVLT